LGADGAVAPSNRIHVAMIGLGRQTMAFNLPFFPLIHEKRDFLNAVQSRGTPMNDAEVGHRTNSINLLGHIAIQLGRPLRWDPKTERVVGDEEANRYVAQPIVEPPKA
jgi:hypothetical protein